jgi:hypothetical protein
LSGPFEPERSFRPVTAAAFSHGQGHLRLARENARSPHDTGTS